MKRVGGYKTRAEELKTLIARHHSPLALASMTAASEYASTLNMPVVTYFFVGPRVKENMVKMARRVPLSQKSPTVILVFFSNTSRNTHIALQQQRRTLSTNWNIFW